MRNVEVMAAAAIAVAAVGVLMMFGNNDGDMMSAAAEHWQEARSFSLPRRALAAVIHRGNFYVVGGVDNRGQYVNTVEFAALGRDGRLGSWRRTSELQRGRFYLAAVAAGDYLYALGGGSGSLGDENQPVASVERARILDDGSLGPWEVISQMNTARRGLKAVVYGDNLYALGGYNGVFLKTMEHAHIAKDGSLGPWITDASAAQIDRYIHAATLFKHYLVLLGGHMRNAGDVSHGDVEIAPIAQDGSIGPWQVMESSLLIPRFMAEAFALGSYLFLAGGHAGDSRLDSVEYARVSLFGDVEEWQQTLPLRLPRSAAAIAVNADRVYIAGGMAENQVLNSVETARLLPAGGLRP